MPLGVLAVMLVGCGKPAMQVFTSTAGQFSVTLPGVPEEDASATNGSHVFNLSTGGETGYWISYTDFAKDVPPARFASLENCQAAITAAKGTFVSGDACTVAGQKGFEGIGSIPGSTTTLKVKMRLVVVGRRGYMIDAVYDPNDAAAEAEAGQVLESFTVTK
jgi:hypothetical protein